MSGLPSGWEWTTLGEIGVYLNGRGFKKSEWRDTGRPIIRIQNLTGSGQQFNYYEGEAEDRHTVRDGDLLLSWAATLGVYVWRGPEAVLNQHIFKVESFVGPAFHRWLLEHVLADLRRQTHGSGMVHITKGRFNSTPVPLPPLAEQERIVDAIEEHLSRLDSGTGVLESAERRLRLFEEAVEARLLAAGWPSMTLASLAEFVTDGDHRPPPRAPEGVPHLTAKHVRGGQLTLQGCTFVSEEGYRQTRSRYEPRSGDVIVTCVGTVGEIAVVPPGLRFSADRNLAAVRLPTDSRVRPEWVAAVLATARYRRFLMAASGSTAQPHLYLKDLRRVEIPVPPRSAQDELLAELREFNHRSRRLDATLSLAEHRSAAMRRSILAAAFSGGLVPQDPDDEPGPVLLERIRAERGAVSPRSTLGK